MPCLSKLEQPIEAVFQVSYQNPDSDPLTWSIDEKRSSDCREDQSAATYFNHECDTALEQTPVLDLESETIVVSNFDPMMLYRLEIQQSTGHFRSPSIFCLMNVTFRSKPIGAVTGTSTTEVRTTGIDNMTTHEEKTQNSFQIWLIFFIIAIVVIGICAGAVFIRQRKLQEYQSDSVINSRQVDRQSNQMQDNKKSHEDAISNPTNGEGFLNKKDEEYHPYDEIDVKVPRNSEMIYNSAYESAQTNIDMVYNCAYESGETNSAMVNNCAYKSEETNKGMVKYRVGESVETNFDKGNKCANESVGANNNMVNNCVDESKETNIDMVNNCTYASEETNMGRVNNFVYERNETKSGKVNNCGYESVDTNIDMAYKCAFGSEEINISRVYNCAHESEETSRGKVNNCDTVEENIEMDDNCAYEIEEKNDHMVYNCAYESD
ncbi:hypothetical protein HOLleu_23476 [Holothuria leucospilota]|uniref:Uncharacterized protein n=1 Tax=Holothuria leucospilota TaxID=206669 RepID=A0A9Q1BU97_HOLLE|nr:hypothetical protein HOLleu_23476 [Holothuria leucospilota]